MVASGNSVIKNVTESNPIYTAQNLTAGALAGQSAGSITESRLSLNLRGILDSAGNQTEMTLGGVGGSVSGSITDLYMNSSADGSGGDRIENRAFRTGIRGRKRKAGSGDCNNGKR